MRLLWIAGATRYLAGWLEEWRPKNETRQTLAAISLDVRTGPTLMSLILRPKSASDMYLRRTLETSEEESPLANSLFLSLSSSLADIPREFMYCTRTFRAPTSATAASSPLSLTHNSGQI